ncbi:MAG: PKD domain-containing protein, partial [Methanospirillum sp.]
MNLRPFALLLCLALIAVPTSASVIVKFTPAPLSVSRITPAVGCAGSSGSYLIRGTGFSSGTSVVLVNNSTWISATDETVQDNWDIQCRIAIPSDADLGPYTIMVANPGGSPTGSYASRSDAFTVIAPMPPPVASFTANAAEGSVPLSLEFMDTSSGPIDSWIWDFDDGRFSTQQNPIHTFVSEGNYAVNLTVSNAGGSNSTTRTIYVRIGQLVDADFVANVTSGVLPLTVQFTDLSTSADPFVSWKWDFESDGIIDSIERNPVHVYTTATTYTVTLKASTEYRLDALTKVGYITVTVPPSVIMVPGGTGSPMDMNSDDKYEDVNGNGRADFTDVVLYFNQ